MKKKKVNPINVLFYRYHHKKGGIGFCVNLHGRGHCLYRYFTPEQEAEARRQAERWSSLYKAQIIPCRKKLLPRQDGTRDRLIGTH